MMVSIAANVERHWSHLRPWHLCALASAFAEFYQRGSGVHSFDGAWVGRGIIKGSLITWEKGRTSALRIIALDILEMEVRGHLYKGRLEKGGERIIWSDGDEWTRGEMPFAAFQKKLRREIKKRGVSHKIERCRLGPEKWSEKA